VSVDHSIDFRRAIVTALNGDPTVSALITQAYGPVVSPGQIYDFIRTGPIDPEAFEASCLSGMETEFNIHVFAKGDDEAPCGAIAKAVVTLFDDAVLTFAGAHTVALDWVRTQFVRDTDEADVWHAIATFAVQTSDDF